MMSSKLYNSPFEMSLHILLILSECSRPITIDRIIACDFMTVYSTAFGLSDIPLNGENGFAFSEYATRRSVTQQAIKELVLDELIVATRSGKGLLYSISKSGQKACAILHSEYADSFRYLCKLPLKKYSRIDDVKLVKVINDAAAKSLRR